MSYGYFSQFYDSLTDDVDYKSLADYYEEILKRFQKKPLLILDAACGTGNLTIELSSRGYDMIGVDSSIEMLMIAREKAQASGSDILFLNQQIENMDLYGTIDAVFCSLDSINHICSYENLVRAFKKISLFLDPEGIFIFDVNTVYKHRKILDGNAFVRENDDLFCVWRCALTGDNVTAQIQIDFFQKSNGMYKRYSEQFLERAYTGRELDDALSEAGLSPLAVFGDRSFSEPLINEERIFYVVRKV